MKTTFTFLLLLLFPFCVTAQEWTLTDMFCAPDAEEYDGFNVSYQDEHYLAVSSYDDMIVGGNEFRNVGALYLYEKSANGLWEFAQKIVPPIGWRAPHLYFGMTACMNDEYLFIGSAGDANDVPNSGVVFVYIKGSVSYGFVGRLTPAYAYENGAFGASMAMNEDFLFIGYPGDDFDANEENERNNTGSVMMYQLNDQGKWEFERKIVSPDRMENSSFGGRIALSGKGMVVSAYRYPYENSTEDQGRVYYYEYESLLIPRGWNYKSTIVNPGYQTQSAFGLDLALEGSTLVIGDYRYKYDADGYFPKNYAGIVYIYVRHPISNSWNLQATLDAKHREVAGNFGLNVSLSGDFLAVGCHRDDTDEFGANSLDNAGAVYLFSKKSGQWLFFDKIVSPARTIDGFYGNKLALDQGCLTVSEPNSTAYGEGFGAVLCYEYVPGTGMQDPLESSGIRTYPNPVNDRLIIEVADNQLDGRLKLLSSDGKVVLQEALHKPIMEVYTGALKPGVYLLIITYNGKTFKEKVIVN